MDLHKKCLKLWLCCSKAIDFFSFYKSTVARKIEPSDYLNKTVCIDNLKLMKLSKIQWLKIKILQNRLLTFHEFLLINRNTKHNLKVSCGLTNKNLPSPWVNPVILVFQILREVLLKVLKSKFDLNFWQKWKFNKKERERESVRSVVDCLESSRS